MNVIFHHDENHLYDLGCARTLLKIRSYESSDITQTVRNCDIFSLLVVFRIYSCHFIRGFYEWLIELNAATKCGSKNSVLPLWTTL